MNNTALAIIQPNELATIQEAAKVLALSGYFNDKGNTPQAIAQIATKILAGRELGFGPFASVNGIHIIQGRPSIGANLMGSAVKSSARYDYRVKEMSGDRCVIEFFERSGDKLVSIGVSEFSKEDAKSAGTQNMNKFARNMLFARAMSNGVRWYCPDVFSGNAVYVPEELGAEVDGDGNVISVVGRRVEPTTGEIIDMLTTQEAPGSDSDTQQGNRATEGENNGPDDGELELMDTWKSPADAQEWAVDIGACENIHEARNSFQNLVKDQFGGKCTTGNIAAVYLAYMRKQEAKLEALFQAEQKEAA